MLHLMMDKKMHGMVKNMTRYLALMCWSIRGFSLSEDKLCFPIRTNNFLFSSPHSVWFYKIPLAVQSETAPRAVKRGLTARGYDTRTNWSKIETSIAVLQATASKHVL